jgi:hypothetical protein
MCNGLVTSQRGGARHCFEGRVGLLWEKPKFGPYITLHCSDSVKKITSITLQSS